MAFFKKKFKAARANVLRKQAARIDIRSKAQAAGLREREKQSIRIAEEREKARAERKIRSFRQGSSFGKGLKASGKAVLGGLDSLTKPRRATPVTVGRTKKKSKAKRRTVRRGTPPRSREPAFPNFENMF